MNRFHRDHHNQLSLAQFNSYNISATNSLSLDIHFLFRDYVTDCTQFEDLDYVCTNALTLCIILQSDQGPKNRKETEKRAPFVLIFRGPCYGPKLVFFLTILSGKCLFLRRLVWNVGANFKARIRSFMGLRGE